MQIYADEQAWNKMQQGCDKKIICDLKIRGKVFMLGMTKFALGAINACL